MIQYQKYYENKELWNTDMQVGKPYTATILKNYHIFLFYDRKLLK